MTTVTVHGATGDWSIFRRENMFCEKDVDRKHGPVPFPRRQGDSPIFAANKCFSQATSLTPRKLGQSPVNVYMTINRLHPARPIRPGIDPYIRLCLIFRYGTRNRQAHVGTGGHVLERAEAIRTALSLGMPLAEIEQYLDWLDTVRGPLPDTPEEGRDEEK